MRIKLISWKQNGCLPATTVCSAQGLNTSITEIYSCKKNEKSILVNLRRKLKNKSLLNVQGNLPIKEPEQRNTDGQNRSQVDSRHQWGISSSLCQDEAGIQGFQGSITLLNIDFGKEDDFSILNRVSCPHPSRTKRFLNCVHPRLSAAGETFPTGKIKSAGLAK